MYIYITFFVIFLIFAMLSTDKFFFQKELYFLKPYFFVLSFFLILIAGFREIGVSVDDLNYLYIYNSANRGLAFKDIAFVILSRIIPDFHLLLIVLAFFSISLKSIFFTYHLKYLGVGFLLYYSSYYFLHDIVQIRAAVASGLLFWIIIYASRKNLIHYIFLIIIAISFHLSALIFIPIYFLRKKNVRIFYIVFAIISLLIGLFFPIEINSFKWLFPEIILSRLTLFLEEAGSSANLLNPISILHYLMVFLVLYKWNDIVNHSKYSVFIAKVFLFGVCLFLIFHKIPGIGFRIYELLVITQIPLIDIFIQKIKPKTLVISGSILLSLLYFYYYIIKYPVVNSYSFHFL